MLSHFKSLLHRYSVVKSLIRSMGGPSFSAVRFVAGLLDYFHYQILDICSNDQNGREYCIVDMLFLCGPDAAFSRSRYDVFVAPVARCN
jgi:hypothetical protein